MFPYPDSAIQESFLNVAKFLPHRKTDELLKRLHSYDSKERSSAMWEVLIGSQFCRRSKFEFEPEAGSKRPEFAYGRLWYFRGTVEIKSISDAGIHERNPIIRLQNLFTSYMLKHPELEGELKLDVYWVSESRKLALPAFKDIPAFFESEIKPFLDELCNPSGSSKILRFHRHDVKFALRFNPERKGLLFHCPVFDQPKGYPNSLGYAFREAKSQLAPVRRGTKIVAICDGGSSFFKGQKSCDRIDAAMAKALDDHDVFDGVVFVSPSVDWDRNQKCTKENRIAWKVRNNDSFQVRRCVRSFAETIRKGLPIPKANSNIFIHNRYNSFGDRPVFSP